MRRCVAAFACVLACAAASDASVGYYTRPVRVPATAADPVAAVTGLITRLLGAAYVPAFTLEVIPADAATGRDVFETAPPVAAGRVTLRGNTGVSLASALGWYLKYACNASFTWGRDGSGNQLRTVPPPAALPAPTATDRHVKTVAHVYGYNTVTAGYTTAFWDAVQWQAEIDRLALWGVDLPLAFAGQEAAWLAFWVGEGLDAADVLSFFSGPAFLPWQVRGRCVCVCVCVCVRACVCAWACAWAWA